MDREPVMQLNANEIRQLIAQLEAADGRTARLWIDSMDGGIKTSIGHGTWSFPPIGDILP